MSEQINSQSYARSLRAVLLYNLAETFDLVDEEIVWVGHKLDDIVQVLEHSTPDNPTLSMQQEALRQTYTKLLSIRTKAHRARGNVAHSASTTTPSLMHWIDALAQPIESSYSSMPGKDALHIRQVIAGILRDIGVGDPELPRGCTRLPLELKMLMAEEKYALASS